MPVRVLIAEEVQECCQLFRQFLQCCGYEVTAVHDGMSCIESLLDGPTPDVLILSWELPWEEGEGVLHWLQDQGNQDMAVVMLTARADPITCEQELALPDVTWLQRPFRLLELLHAVQSTERVPRNSWRCLETLWSKNARPVHGVLFRDDVTTENSVHPTHALSSGLALDMQPAAAG